MIQDDGTVTYYADYFPFGWTMPGRNGGDAYRYAYQGQEKDPETGWEAFELRMYDGRVGRWMTTDPYSQYHSPYLAMGNNPMNTIDPDGGKVFWHEDKDGNLIADKGDSAGSLANYLGISQQKAEALVESQGYIHYLENGQKYTAIDPGDKVKIYETEEIQYEIIYRAIRFYDQKGNFLAALPANPFSNNENTVRIVKQSEVHEFKRNTEQLIARGNITSQDVLSLSRSVLTWDFSDYTGVDDNEHYRLGYMCGFEKCQNLEIGLNESQKTRALYGAGRREALRDIRAGFQNKTDFHLSNSNPQIKIFQSYETTKRLY